MADLPQKNAYCKKLIRLKISYLYSQICNERSPLEQKKWSFKKGDLLKEVKFI